MSETIVKAIKSRKIITFLYKGTIRTVMPHILGVNHKGNLILSAWQFSDEKAGWRSFKVIECDKLQPNGCHFETYVNGYNPDDPSMAYIVALVGDS